MPTFRVTFERTQRDIAATEIEADNQTAALNKAEEMVESGRIEGWQPAGEPTFGVASVEAG